MASAALAGAATIARRRGPARALSTAAGSPWRVCIIGSGPAGFYTADALLRGSPAVHVDVIDRLPVPFGLVRFGVAPDHPEVKNVTERFTEIARSGRVTFAGNVTVADGTGASVSVSELRERYSAVVLACGADDDRQLGVPGEDLEGVHSARHFVEWYNGHPSAAAESWDLSLHDTAVIIGQGNVALDVARVLLKPVAELAPTDICAHAVRALERSSIRRVILAGRRGPLQAAFTTKELRELSKLDGCTLTVDTGAPDALDEAALATVAKDRPRKRQAELLRTLWLESEARGGAPPTDREAVLAFHRAPHSFGAADGAAGTGGRVASATFERTRVEGGRAVGTGELESTACGYVFTSIGYKSSPLPGVPFDSARARVPTAEGRVLESDGAASAAPVQGLYASGWYKRGPSGVILTNISDASETAAAILADWESGKLAAPDAASPRAGLADEGAAGLAHLLEERSVCSVGFDGWERIDAHEREQGEAAGKRLAKVTDVGEMLRLARPNSN